MKSSNRYVTDTHPLIWFATGDKSLSETAKGIFMRAENLIYVPVLVLVESNYLYQKGKITCRGFDLKNDISCMDNWSVIDFSLDLLDYCPGELNIHDAMICAFARQEGMAVITRDKEICEYKGVETIW